MTSVMERAEAPEAAAEVEYITKIGRFKEKEDIPEGWTRVDKNLDPSSTLWLAYEKETGLGVRS